MMMIACEKCGKHGINCKCIPDKTQLDRIEEKLDCIANVLILKRTDYSSQDKEGAELVTKGNTPRRKDWKDAHS